MEQRSKCAWTLSPGTGAYSRLLNRVPHYNCRQAIGRSLSAVRLRLSKRLEISHMKRIPRTYLCIASLRPHLVTLALTLFLAVPVFAQANSPWENAVNVLQQAFTSTIARGLSLVAIVVSGLTFAFARLRQTSPIPSMLSSTSSEGPAGSNRLCETHQSDPQRARP